MAGGRGTLEGGIIIDKDCKNLFCQPYETVVPNVYFVRTVMKLITMHSDEIYPLPDKTTTEGSYNDGSVEEGKPYYYKVQLLAKCGYGERESGLCCENNRWR